MRLAFLQARFIGRLPVLSNLFPFLQSLGRFRTTRDRLALLCAAIQRFFRDAPFFKAVEVLSVVDLSYCNFDRMLCSNATVLKGCSMSVVVLSFSRPFRTANVSFLTLLSILGMSGSKTAKLLPFSFRIERAHQVELDSPPMGATS